MAKVTFYSFETTTCGDGCCTYYEEEKVTTRKVTPEQLDRLYKEVEGDRYSSYWTEDFGIEGEDEKFYYYTVVD